MTTAFTELRDLRRDLLRHEVDLETLPPFALSPEQTHCLKSDARMLHYPSSQSPEEVLMRGCCEGKTVELRGLDDTGVFTIQGLRCVRADRLG